MAEQREVVQFLVTGGVSVQRACVLAAMQRSTFRYVAHPRDDAPLLDQLHVLTNRYPRYG